MLHFIHNIDTVALLLLKVSLWCLIYYLSGRNEVALPWLRQLVAGRSMVRPGFIPRANPCRFCGGQSSTWRTEILGGKSDLITPFPPHIHPRTKTNPVS